MKALEVKQQIALRNILFATDFSPAATSAAAYAAEIAKHYGAKLFAFHVQVAVICVTARYAENVLPYFRLDCGKRG